MVYIFCFRRKKQKIKDLTFGYRYKKGRIDFSILP